MSSEHSSHDAFEHDSIDALGYDWERIAVPQIGPRHPTKVYLPRSTEHVSAALQEIRRLQQSIRIRSKGHSSNDLVCSDGGNILCTELMNRIGPIDVARKHITVQAGAVLADVDETLAV